MRLAKIIRDELRLGVTPALFPTPHGSPVHETLHVHAILPRQPKELTGIELGRFRSQEGFKAPTQVRALPWCKTIAPGNNPVVVKGLEHFPVPTIVPVPPSSWARGLDGLAESLSQLRRERGSATTCRIIYSRNLQFASPCLVESLSRPDITGVRQVAA
jgi:hypothetical protein